MSSYIYIYIYDYICNGRNLSTLKREFHMRKREKYLLISTYL
jgi:hypothetical protein